MSETDERSRITVIYSKTKSDPEVQFSGEVRPQDISQILTYHVRQQYFMNYIPDRQQYNREHRDEIIEQNKKLEERRIEESQRQEKERKAAALAEKQRENAEKARAVRQQKQEAKNNAAVSAERKKKLEEAGNQAILQMIKEGEEKLRKLETEDAKTEEAIEEGTGTRERAEAARRATAGAEA